MPNSRFPTPPETDNPIVLIRSTARLRKELVFLDEFVAAYEAGDVDRAARCATSAISASLERELVNSLVATVNNMAAEVAARPKSVTEMLCKAADAGFHAYAYNAANNLMHGAKSVKRYKEAEHYYKLAMAFTDDPQLQAAAYVNYCPIVRDGLISGTRDWPAAVELYEGAARMGLIKGMFNAGNVSSWLANEGDRTYGARAAQWFEYAIKFHAERQPKLDFETWAELEAEVIENCILELSACHIDSKFDGADLETGITWARQLAVKGHAHAKHNLSVGYTNRLMTLEAAPQSTPGANWRTVLERLDWSFEGDVRTEQVVIPVPELRRHLRTPVDRLTVRLAPGKTLPMFVTHEPCLPVKGGDALLNEIANALALSNPGGFFLTTRRALFVQAGRRAHTSIYVIYEGQGAQLSLWLGCTPADLVENARAEVDFLDERYGSRNCSLPIAINALDEGYVVARNATLGQPYARIGSVFCLPYLNPRKLLAIGVSDEGLPDGLQAAAR